MITEHYRRVAGSARGGTGSWPHASAVRGSAASRYEAGPGDGVARLRVEGGPLVLAYHAVHGAEEGVEAPDVITPPDVLEAHIRHLADCGYRFRTADQMVAETGRRRPPNGAAILTFDDGWLDGLTVAASILCRLHIPATFFLCPGLWGGHDARMGEAGRVLTVDQARELHEAGMDLGAHSMSHPDLRALDDRSLASELADSKAAVEAITGRPCRTLAYPFGVHDPRVERAASRAGFAVAFTFSAGPWRPLAVPRLPAPRTAGLRVVPFGADPGSS